VWQGLPGNQENEVFLGPQNGDLGSLQSRIIQQALSGKGGGQHNHDFCGIQSKSLTIICLYDNIVEFLIILQASPINLYGKPLNF